MIDDAPPRVVRPTNVFSLLGAGFRCYSYSYKLHFALRALSRRAKIEMGSPIRLVGRKSAGGRQSSNLNASLFIAHILFHFFSLRLA